MPDTIPAPTPTEAPETVRPEVWAMPSIGESWCDCGDSEHRLDADTVEDLAGDLLDETDEGGLVPHLQVVRAVMELWCFEEVCQFFHDRLNASCTAVARRVRPAYRRSDAVDIVGYFSKTWQGCPQMAFCEGGYGWDDVPGQ